MLQVTGVENLMETLAGFPLAGVHLFSSVSATLGNPGQANYAAANAVLEAKAAEFESLGVRTAALGWGPWAAGGMAAQQSGLLRRLRGQGSIFELRPRTFRPGPRQDHLS